MSPDVQTGGTTRDHDDVHHEYNLNLAFPLIPRVTNHERAARSMRLPCHPISIR